MDISNEVEEISGNDTKTMLVIPSYNDCERLSPFLQKLTIQLPKTFNIQVVDDGSSQKEKERLENLILSLKKESVPNLLSPLYLKKNRGKGYAIRTGWKQRTNEDILAFTDADGSASIKDIIEIDAEMRLDKSNEAIFGIRKSLYAQNSIRKLSSSMFSSLTKWAIESPLKDTQCGIKFLRTPLYDRIEGSLTENGYCIDIDLIIMVRSLNIVIKEYPVNWTHQEKSKINLYKDSLKMIKDILRLRKKWHSISQKPGL